ncbi:MAG: (Fe-S)-binding protein [Candidatus Marinimicrobia bacterium]|nr:(Fe-S)-binding protein [Candidatus Neomarinimicrobiota bacterium]
MLHGQGISVEPKQIIKSIPGITLLSLIESDTCCGSAGSYSITETEMSLKVLERKMNHIASTGADCVVTANPGCQIQLQWGMYRKNLSVEVLHIAELLDRAYQKSNGYPLP